MTATTPARPHYHDDQIVDAALLSDGQAWLEQTRRRHAAALHRWGVICGLALVVDGDGQPRLEAGAAVTDDGAVLRLAEPRRLALPSADVAAVDLWLRSGDPQPLPFVFVAGDRPVDPDHAADPSGTAAVYLGRLARAADGWRVVTVRRRFAGVVAGVACDPGGTVAIGLGATGAGGGVTVTASASASAPASVREAAPLLVIDRDGAAALGGALRGRSVTLEGDGLRFVRSSDGPPAPGTLSALPDGVALTLPVGGRLVVGVADGAEFRSLLVIDSAGNLTAGGVLKIAGRLGRAPLAVDPDDPDFVSALRAALGPVPTPAGGGGAAP